MNLPPGMPTPKAAGELPLNQIHGFMMSAILSLRQRGIETLGGLCDAAEKQPGSHREKLVAAMGPIDQAVAGWAADAVLDHLHPGRVSRPPKPEPPMPARRELPTASLSLHELAHLVPEMHPDQFKAFAADVKARGVQEPLKLIPGTKTVIDGRTRLRAATEAGLASVPVEDADLGDNGPVVYMLRVAYLRRNLKPAQAAKLGNEIKKQLGAEMRQRKKEGGQKGGEKSGQVRRGEPSKDVADRPQASAGKKTRGPAARDQAAAMAGTSPKAIDTAAKIEAKAPDVYAKMGTGEVPTLAAAKKAAGIAEPHKQKPAPIAFGTPFSQIPNFPADALAPLGGNGISTLEDLDARVAKLAEEKGKKNVSRYTALTDAGLEGQLVMKVGQVLGFAPAKPTKGKPDESTPAEKICSLLHDLTPCPFCGAPDEKLAVLSGATHNVGCHECGTVGPSKSSKEAARAAWNKRVKK